MQQNWMLYGAAGYTGSLIAARAVECGHRPVLAGRSAPAVTALAERLDLPHRVLDLEDPVALEVALDDVDLVLNAAGPFLHTAAPLAKGCLRAGAHYLDISNELQVFRNLYDLDEEATQVGVSIIPGVGFGVVATNCLARYVSEMVGGAAPSRGGLPGRVRPSRDPVRRRPCKRISPTEAGSVRADSWSPRSSSPGSRRLVSPTDLARRCPSRPEIWRRPSMPQELPTSWRTQ